MSLEHAPERGHERSRRGRRALRGRFKPLLLPMLDAFEMIGVGKTKGYELVKSGKIETVTIGGRRYATMRGLDALAAPHITD